jgi:phospholipid/cholesterol/gamma-HCH transport system permease protein
MKDKDTAFAEYQRLTEEDLQLVVGGRLDTETTGPLWAKAVEKVAQVKPKTLIIDATAVQYCDGAGAGLLLKLKRRQESCDRLCNIVGLKPEFRQLMDLFDPGELSGPVSEPASFVKMAEHIGEASVALCRNLCDQVSFLGELCAKLFFMVCNPLSLRWKDTFLLAEKSGADAVGITALLGFLIGLILAFQSAVSMQKFGAEIYVADLVVLSLFRELGPLLTAFVLAARTGSAFAAEIGTMKVNEEIDALTTMGLEPVRFLVIPRILAAVFVTPLLTMFLNVFGLIGCGLVMVSIGFAPITFLHQIQEAATLTDLLSGLAKTFVFGALIAGIGCSRGLKTGTGASAVGDSATRAVVTSIVAIVVVDGAFAVVYYFLGI